MVTTPIITFIADSNEPDLYNDITDFPNPFTMKIPIGIANTHPSATLYFKVSIVLPPAAYSVSFTNLGSLAIGSSAIFTFTPERSLPTLTAGEYDETLTLRVDAYTDPGYTVAYANQTLNVTIHHFNHTDGSWIVVRHDTFDGADNDGWGGVNCGKTSAYGFLSSPCAFVCAYDQNQGYSWSGYKNFVVGNYTKARFILHIKAPDPYNQQSVEINIDGVAKKQRDVHLPADTWCRLAYNMPVNKTTLVRVHSQTYSGAVVIDEIWVIAK
jgi:hypothetical protein